eukprot:gene12478-12612_t
MSVAVAIADFSSSYGNKRLSDVTVVIFEEPGPDAQSLRTKRAAPEKAEELPGHGVVLLSSSEYCPLENWADNSSDGKYRIELPVPPGQLELGKLLVKGMYYSNLDLSGFTQQQLLHVLLLADRYGVPKVLAAISSFLESIPPAELQWDTAMAIYNLPPGCTEEEACGGLDKAASAKVQQELGDLELVWHDQEEQQKQQWLLDLPHKALKQLLESPLTAVNSENTNCLSCQEMGIAAVLASDRWEVVHEAHHPVLKQHPAWAADRRPESKCKQGVIDWKVPVGQVQQLIDSNLDAVQRLYGPQQVYAINSGGPITFLRDCDARGDGRGWPSFIECGNDGSWAAVLGVLRSQHLIHPAEAGISSSEEFIHIRWDTTNLQ